LFPKGGNINYISAANQEYYEKHIQPYL